MAKNKAETNPITVKDIVKGEHYSQAYAEKILQSLRSANIVTSLQGNQGGYILSRHPSEITLKEIVEALEEQTFDIFCDPGVRKDIVCNHFPSCTVKPIWEKTKELLNTYYSSITLEMVAKNEIKAPQLLNISKK